MIRSVNGQTYLAISATPQETIDWALNAPLDDLQQVVVAAAAQLTLLQGVADSRQKQHAAHQAKVKAGLAKATAARRARSQRARAAAKKRHQQAAASATPAAEPATAPVPNVRRVRKSKV